MSARLFAYGTLTRRGRLEALTGARLPEPRPAVLRGFRKYDTGRGYPIVLEEPGHQVQGWLWDVTDDSFPELDHYEGADEDPPFYFRREVEVEVEGGTVKAWVYVGNPEAFPDRRPLPDDDGPETRSQTRG